MSGFGRMSVCVFFVVVLSCVLNAIPIQITTPILITTLINILIRHLHVGEQLLKETHHVLRRLCVVPRYHHCAVLDVTLQRQQVPVVAQRSTQQCLHSHTRSQRIAQLPREGSLRKRSRSIVVGSFHTLDHTSTALVRHHGRHVRVQTTHTLQQRSQLAIRLVAPSRPRRLVLIQSPLCRFNCAPQRQRHALHLLHQCAWVVVACRFSQLAPRYHVGRQCGSCGNEVSVSAEWRETRRVLRVNTTPLHHAVNPLVPRRRPSIVVNHHEVVVNRVHCRLQPLVHGVQRVDPLALTTHHSHTPRPRTTRDRSRDEHFPPRTLTPATVWRHRGVGGRKRMCCR